jgi:hypothetical protein
MPETRSGICDYCLKPIQTNILHLCDECEDSLQCEGCGATLKSKSWVEFYPDKFFCDSCARQEEIDFQRYLRASHHLLMNTFSL